MDEFEHLRGQVLDAGASDFGHVVEAARVAVVDDLGVYDERSVFVELDQDVLGAEVSVDVSELHHHLQELANRLDELGQYVFVLLLESVEAAMLDGVNLLAPPLVGLDRAQPLLQALLARVHGEPRVLGLVQLLVQSGNVPQADHGSGFSVHPLDAICAATMVEN